MKKLTVRFVAFIFILCMSVTPALAAETLVPVGRVIGLELENGTVTVAGFTEDSPAKAAGVQEGDRIVSIDGSPVKDTAGVREALNHSKGSATLVVQRGKTEHIIRVSPQITEKGPVLGVYLKEGITGIGTVTFYDPDTGSFAALGHGVNSPDGKLLTMTRGCVYDAKVVSVRKGKTGSPGQLVGSVTAAAPAGQLRCNTPQGVFGTLDRELTGQCLPVAEPKEVCTGEATIRSTVCGDTVQEYSVQILKIYPNSRSEGRNMLIKITDPALLETTGGIVQGMSGSPILQDGRIVGAVTHVLVNDPTTGYGIFIENMLEAAS